MAKVFISYSKRDYLNDDGTVIQNNVIDKVMKSLTDHGIDFWIDREKLDPGVTFASIIANSINDCDFFLFLSSSNSNSSPWTLREISMAIDSAKTVIPVRLDDSKYADPVSLYLASIQYIDWAELGEQESLKRIVKRIKGAEPENGLRHFSNANHTKTTTSIINQYGPTLKNASMVLAGGACILLVLTHLFSTYGGLIPIRGFWYCSLLTTSLLCLWCGMLIRSWIGKPRDWFLVLIGLLIACGLWVFYELTHTGDVPSISDLRYEYVFQFLLGLLIPWNLFRENGDHAGVKSGVLCIITALSYATIYLVLHRLGHRMKAEFTDMEQLLIVVTTYVLPLASIPPLILAAEFSYSKAGQWLGSRRWFFWLSAPASIYCFLGIITSNLHLPIYPSRFYQLIQFLVQPVTVYLLIVIVRIIKKFSNKGSKDSSSWKEVFKL